MGTPMALSPQAQELARRNDAALRRGLRDTGPLPREFRLSSKWADL